MKKTKKVYDYQQCLNTFVGELKKLQKHIEQHRMHMGWKLDVAEIKKARKLYAKFKDKPFYYGKSGNLKVFFDYLSKNMQSWWC